MSLSNVKRCMWAISFLNTGRQNLIREKGSICFYLSIKFLGQNGITWKQKPQNNYNECFPRYEIKYKDKCEQYNDKECKVNNVESCNEKEFRNCELVPKEDHERMCETVKEMHCELKRTVVEKEVESYVPKLKCHSLKSNIFMISFMYE